MRGFLLVLLLANTVYFAWAQSQARFWESEPSAEFPTPKIDTKLPRLRLVAELPPGERQDLGDVNLSQRRLENNVAGGRCWIVGPMPEVVTAKQVMLRFQKMSLPARLVEAEIDVGASYRVYIGPFDSETEVLEKLKLVHAAGLDGFLITSGPLAGSISLGDYENLAEASSAIDHLAAQGFEGNFREQPQLITQQWVVVPLQESALVEDSFWVELDLDFNKLERKQTWCGAIASAS